MRPIYLDYHATTPLDPRVYAVMRPYFEERFGNPHSANHVYGWEAEAAVELAREQVAAVLHAAPQDIVFTSGATESNNLALKGLARMERNMGKGRRHIVTVVTEHKCVLESARALEEEGFRVTYLPVPASGIVACETVAEVLSEDTLLLSVMAANNEIGVLQPLAELGALCAERGVFFHTDAAQAFGKIPLDVDRMGIDLLSVSAHKIYGPKGVGALFVRSRPKRVRLEPLFHGGGQEKHMRSGTLPTPLIVGLGEAARIAEVEREEEHARLLRWRTQFWERLQAAIPEARMHGDSERRLAGSLNFSLPNIQAESFLSSLKTLAISAGAACASASHEPSYVLQALGVSSSDIRASLRVSFGRMTTEAEIMQALERILEKTRIA